MTEETNAIPVPAVSPQDKSGVTGGGLAVTRIQVARGNFQQSLSLSLYFCNGQPHEEKIELVLSPPAAAMLSRELKKELKEYLRGSRPTH